MGVRVPLGRADVFDSGEGEGARDWIVVRSSQAPHGALRWFFVAYKIAVSILTVASVSWICSGVGCNFLQQPVSLMTSYLCEQTRKYLVRFRTLVMIVVR